ncbi:hypothetical protein LUZ63_000035 [Rhynchospora breviuscula]|uniref:Uncharacterized protein n=1 Tax=Rhynchospora breviuscula TaxID=2022672 RepID=A0A9Q0HVT6_9POAL|nr:hypothetical protein LUZ63_000035 [Rhynchospora breviuscula]
MTSPTSHNKSARPPPPPPLIARAGNLTIFITPPPSTNIIINNPIPSPLPVPVQAPPLRSELLGDPVPAATTSLHLHLHSLLSHFLNTSLAKAQHVHSSLDSYVADWFGLNHSKYQRELNDYYQTMQKSPKNEFGRATKPKDNSSKNEAL